MGLFFGEAIEFFLPGDGLLRFSPILVKADNMTDGDAPLIWRHLGGGGEESLRTWEHERLGFWIGFARHVNGTEPVRSLAGQFGPEPTRGIIVENCQCRLQPRLGLVQFALFNQNPAQVE